MLRRYATIGAALATAMLAVLVPVAGTAVPAFDRAALIRQLEVAIADEERALQLLGRNPPRVKTAVLALDRSRMRLHQILEDHGPSTLPGSVVGGVADARNTDKSVMERLATPGLLAGARKDIEFALRRKRQASGALITPASANASQCGDGRDNDGDLLVDARYESGCTDAKDNSEGGALSCSLGYTPINDTLVVKGTCSGPFFKLEITAPPGVKFKTKSAPVVVQDRVCYFPRERELDCVMGDGMANPGHVVDVRWQGGSPQAPRSLKVRIIEFAGRSRTFALSQKPTAPPTEPPFSTGAAARNVKLTYTQGQGGCPIATSFTADGKLLAPGDGFMTLTLPPNQVMKGPVDPKGAFQMASGTNVSYKESYKGKFAGNTATGTYTYTTPDGCIQIYVFVIELQG